MITKILILEDPSVTCENALIIKTCNTSKDNRLYPCKQLFDDVTSSLWKSRKDNDWVQLNLDTNYHIERLRIFTYSASGPKNLTLNFLSGLSFNTYLINAYAWHDIILPSNVLSHYIKMTVNNDYGYLGEIQISGCLPGN